MTLNRVHMFRESPHPYTATTDYVFPNVGRPSVGGMTVDVKAHLPMVDLANNGSYVRLEDSDGGVLLGTTEIDGGQFVDLWTPWVTQAPGRQPQLKFHAVAPTGSPRGFLMTEFEFRRYQTTYPLFTPLRGAGQYWDRETDMFENWNRYYDSSTGRYLSPEPMLQSPNWVMGEARDGRGSPTYAYALNNPVTNIDEDGLRTKPPSRPRPSQPKLPRSPPPGLHPPDDPVPDGTACKWQVGKIVRTKFQFYCGGDLVPVCITPGLDFEKECAECYANAAVVANDLRSECGEAAKKACDDAGCRKWGRRCP